MAIKIADLAYVLYPDPLVRAHRNGVSRWQIWLTYLILALSEAPQKLPSEWQLWCTNLILALSEGSQKWGLKVAGLVYVLHRCP